MNAPIPAERWNGLIREVMRARAIAGLGCKLKRTASGCGLSGSATTKWRHPWQLRPRWRHDSTLRPLGGVWTAAVRPGFVNARDVSIEVRSNKTGPDGQPSTQIPLTDEAPPKLEFGAFRDPAGPGGLDASLSEEIIVKPGEGYPKFFEKLGVVPAAKGGKGLGAMDAQPDPLRARQIRACDVALVTPRMATHQQVDVHDALTDAQSVSISTAFDNTAQRNAKSAHWLITTTKWQPPAHPTEEDKLMGTAVEPQTDEIKLATLWLVSPPDTAFNAQPDETWTPYPQHFVFWNLNHASRAQMPSAPPEPITLQTGLLGGLADSIFAALLSPVNDAYAQVSAYLGAADFTGLYWSTERCQDSIRKNAVSNARRSAWKRISRRSIRRSRFGQRHSIRGSSASGTTRLRSAASRHAAPVDTNATA